MSGGIFNQNWPAIDEVRLQKAGELVRELAECLEAVGAGDIVLGPTDAALAAAALRCWSREQARRDSFSLD